MNEQDIKKICDKIAEKLRDIDVPKKPTGKLIVNLQTGGISGNVSLELKL